jgi:streptomycin 3"-adenylyltransferase
VPTVDLNRAMVESLGALLLDLAPDTRNVLLTLARIWSTLATGIIRPKDDAARWATQRLPAEHRPVLERAAAIYRGEAPERWDDLADRIEPTAGAIVAQIRPLAPEPAAE